MIVSDTNSETGTSEAETSQSLDGLSFDELTAELANTLDDEGKFKTEETVQAEPESESEEEVSTEMEAEETVEEETSEEEDSETEEAVEEESEEDNVSEELDMEQTINMKVNVDGVEQDVAISLNELKAGYFRQSDYTRKTQELATEKSKISEQTRTVANDYKARLQEVSDILQVASPVMAQIAQSGLSAPQFIKALGQENPQLAQEYAAHLQQVLTSQQFLKTQREEAVEKEQAEELKQHTAEVREKIFTALPEWNDANTRSNEIKQIQGVLETFGFSKDEMTEIIMSDHRNVLMLRELAKAKATQTISKKGKASKVKSVKNKATGVVSSSKAKIKAASKSGDLDYLVGELSKEM